MQPLVLIGLGLFLVLLFIAAFVPVPLSVRGWRQLSREGAGAAGPGLGRRLTADELAAEVRAEELMTNVVGDEGLEAYRALGFLYAFGDAEDDGQPGYGYLIYPHRPIVSFDARSGSLLSELCVQFPDRSERGPAERLPDADDVLAKWMAIQGDELALLAAANVHPIGRQIDPGQVRRDLLRLQEWTTESTDAGADGGVTTA